MSVPFANLPPNINTAIATLLAAQETPAWVVRAQQLHHKYQTKQKGKKGYIETLDDVLGYLALRVPATYAQMYGALSQVKEVLPSWHPQSVLDIGCGPGTGIWAAKAIWENIQSATCLDENSSFLQVGAQLIEQTAFAADCIWIQKDIRLGLGDSTQRADLVIVGNVLNELHPEKQEKLLGQAFNATKGVLVIVEPGTPEGSMLVSQCARKMQQAGFLIAPYINNSFVYNDKYWLHFAKRFVRPDFQRRIRQSLRTSSQMASDWEEAKYAYVAISQIPSEVRAWGRCVGDIQKYKGFAQVPVLTDEKMEYIKVLKRHTRQYAFLKQTRWGDLLMNKYDIISTQE